jgi:hypothetical protein
MDLQLELPRHPWLTEHVRRVLKSGKIMATPLPLTPEIRLYLLNQDYPMHSLTREETEALMNEPPFWSFCWSSGQVLARWIMEHNELSCSHAPYDIDKSLQRLFCQVPGSQSHKFCR